MKPLSHADCAARVCCRSWSCEPHRLGCEHSPGRAWQPVPTFTRGPVLVMPRVFDERGQPIDDSLAALAAERASLGSPVVRYPDPADGFA